MGYLCLHYHRIIGPLLKYTILIQLFRERERELKVLGISIVQEEDLNINLGQVLPTTIDG